MTTMQQIDGVGAVFVDETGCLRICVSDSCADAFDAASANGVTADQLVDALITQAEAGRAAELIKGPRNVFVDGDAPACRTKGDAGRSDRGHRCGSKRLHHRERWRKRFS